MNNLDSRVKFFESLLAATCKLTSLRPNFCPMHAHFQKMFPLVPQLAVFICTLMQRKIVLSSS